MDTPLALPPIRQQIEHFEAFLGALPQADLALTHLFAKGLYARQITIPAGCALVGLIHKEEHFNFILKGDISVVTEEGTQRIKGPLVMVSQPGTKRVGYAHEETVWVTVHSVPVGMTDVDKLEQLLVTNDHSDLAIETAMVRALENP